MTRSVASLSPVLYEPVIRRALEEDLGRAGDLTTDALIPDDHRATGELILREAGRVCGVEIAAAVFRRLDASCRVDRLAADGVDAAAGEVVARVAGATRHLLVAERTALNLLGRLSGIATATRDLAAKVGDEGPRIACTRKTTPGLRALEKYAVRVGGGSNHRFGLDDAVLIKDNHLAACGSIAEAVSRVRASIGHWVTVECEVDTLEQLREALAAGVDAVLLDNMAPPTLREAVALCGGKVTTEASGGITAETLAEVAATGVDVISVGWLTHSAPALDVGLDIVG